MATGMWLISYGLFYENILASFSAILIGLLNLPLASLLSIFFLQTSLYTTME